MTTPREANAQAIINYLNRRGVGSELCVHLRDKVRYTFLVSRDRHLAPAADSVSLVGTRRLSDVDVER
jgi:hypothetical protein